MLNVGLVECISNIGTAMNIEFAAFFIYAMIQSVQLWDGRVHCATSEV